MRASWPGLCLLVLLAAGCKDPAFTANEDKAFLHPMGREPAPIDLPLERLLPSQPGVRSIMRFSGEPPQPEETTVARGPRRLNGRPCLLFETLQGGRPTRQEWLWRGPDGLYLVQAGGAERIAMDPPLLILPAPLVAERIYPWQGKLLFRGKQIMAQGWTRFRGVETIAVPAGKKTAYRVETVLSAMIGGTNQRLPTTRWFVPDEGLVRVWFQVDSNQFVRERVSP